MKKDQDKAIQETKDACKEVLTRMYKEMGLDISSLDYAEQETKRREVEGMEIKSQYHDETAVGKEAVEASFSLFKESGLKILLLQPDWLLCHKDRWYCIEIKHQTPQDEMFSIPKRQLLARMELEVRLGIKGVVMILNRINKMWYWQYISILMVDISMVENKQYHTYLFPLSSFIPTYFLPD